MYAVQAISRSAANLVRVCVDRADDVGFSGRYYHRYSNSPFLFSTPDDLVEKMDYLFDQLGFPQPTVQLRSFKLQPKPNRGEFPMAKDRVNALEDQTGEMATFVVHVMYRQNATWQGNVFWAEKNQSVNFRSALELIKLMDSALDQSAPEKEE